MLWNRAVLVALVAWSAWVVGGCRPAGPTGGRGSGLMLTPAITPLVVPTRVTAVSAASTATGLPGATGTPTAGGGGGAMGAPPNAVVGSLGATAVVRVGQSLWVAEGGVQVEVLDVLDSRCPPGVKCVRAGEVKAQVRVSEGGRELGTVTLASAPKDAQSKAVGGYTVTLVEVQPPKTQQETPKGEYVLTVSVVKG